MPEIIHGWTDPDGTPRSRTEMLTDQEYADRQRQDWERNMRSAVCQSEEQILRELDEPGRMAILFLAIWSGPDRMLTLQLPETLKDIPPDVKFRVADLDRSLKLAHRLSVRSTGMLVICMDGKIESRWHSGGMRPADFLQKLAGP